MRLLNVDEFSSVVGASSVETVEASHIIVKLDNLVDGCQDFLIDGQPYYYSILDQELYRKTKGQSIVRYCNLSASGSDLILDVYYKPYC